MSYMVLKKIFKEQSKNLYDLYVKNKMLFILEDSHFK